MYNLKNIKDEDVKGKRVLLRVDVDVPIKDGKIEDRSRLKAWFPTLELLLTKQAHVFIAGHLGRPQRVDERFSLEPVVHWVKSQLELHNDLKVTDINGFKAWELTGNVFVLENLRFFNEEEKNDIIFSQKLASIAQIYVNDAFASSHRAHASIVGVTKYLPSFAGLRLIEEVGVLSKVLEEPKRPLGVIIGGAKIETKLPLVEKMHRFADYVMVGGEIAENDKILLKVAHERIQGQKSALLVADLNEKNIDITLKSVENFIQISKKCQTIVWNGPMGLIENPAGTNHATLILAKELSEIGKYIIVGGGDTVGFLKESNLLDKFSFVSTGGGAMLEFLAGVKLPGLLVLEK
jgi:phosphoglycerate kinase